MNVLIDGTIYARQPHGGISRCFTLLLKALERRPDVQVVLSLSAEVRLAEELCDVSVDVQPRAGQLKPYRLFSRLNAGMRRYTEKKYWSTFDKGLFHSSYYTTHNGLRIPQVLTWQDAIYERYASLFNRPKDLQHIAEKRRCLERASALVFPSAFSMNECADLYALPGKVKYVIPYAVDPAFSKRPDKMNIQQFQKKYQWKEPVLMHCGGRGKHKNFIGLVRAFASSGLTKRYRLVSIGGGEITADERALFHELGVNDRISVISGLNEVDLVTAYYAATGFVFPSLSEGYGFPLIEALAAGLPVLAARAGSLPEVGREVPVYCDPASVDSIRDGLLELTASLDDTGRWQRGREVAQSRTWDDVADDYIDVYKQVLNGESVSYE